MTTSILIILLGIVCQVGLIAIILTYVQGDDE